jgi:Ca-activated chloride channel family protein
MLTNFLNEIPQFHFLRPEWLFACIPVIALLAWLRFEKTSQGDWQQLIPKQLLVHLLHEKKGASSTYAIVLLSVLWLLAVIALAGPSWKRIPQPVYEKVEARVYVLDLSYSMYSSDIKPNRIVRARLKLLDLLESKREGLSALVVFSGDAHVVTPLTNDNNTIASLASVLEPRIMPNIGSNASAGIAKALELLSNTQLDKGKIILITDEVTEGEQGRINALMSRNDYQLLILGIGTAEGAPIKLPNGQFMKDKSKGIIIPKLNKKQLGLLAENNRGIFVSISENDSDIETINRDRLAKDEDARESNRNFDIWFDSGQWLMIPILILAAFSFRRGWILSFLLVSALTPYSDNSYAATPINNGEEIKPQQEESLGDKIASWFLTGDQRGLANFKEKKFQEAAEQFNNKDWKASSLFYSGQFAQASELFEADENDKKEKQSSDWYNKGNALAFAGDYDSALSAYDKSLELNPINEDAAFNKDLVEKAKDQEEQQQSQQSQQQDQQNSENKEPSQKDNNSQNNSDPQGGDSQENDSDNQNESDDKNPDNESPNNDNPDNSEPEDDSPEDSEEETDKEKNDAENENQEDSEQSSENDSEQDGPEPENSPEPKIEKSNRLWNNG